MYIFSSIDTVVYIYIWYPPPQVHDFHCIIFYWAIREW